LRRGAKKALVGSDLFRARFFFVKRELNTRRVRIRLCLEIVARALLLALCTKRTREIKALL